MRIQNPTYLNFFNKDDPAFSTFQVTLDNLFKCLRSDGVGAHTETISSSEENELWASGVLNVDSPKGLLRCVFYENVSVVEADKSTWIWGLVSCNNSTNLIDTCTVRKLQRTDLEE